MTKQASRHKFHVNNNNNKVHLTNHIQSYTIATYLAFADIVRIHLSAFNLIHSFG